MVELISRDAVDEFDAAAGERWVAAARGRSGKMCQKINVGTVVAPNGRWFAPRGQAECRVPRQGQYA